MALIMHDLLAVLVPRRFGDRDRMGQESGDDAPLKKSKNGHPPAIGQQISDRVPFEKLKNGNPHAYVLGQNRLALLSRNLAGYRIP